MQFLPNKLEVFVLLNIPKNLGEAHFWGRLQQLLTGKKGAASVRDNFMQ